MRTLLLVPLFFLPQQDEQRAERLLRAVEKRVAAAGDPADVAAMAKKLGDRDRILAFVRDEIGLEPYEGILRNARGTLYHRSGNSLDRALLLQALLQAIGNETRLVRVTLDRSLPMSAPARREGKSVDLKALAADLEADPAKIESLAAEARRSDAKLVDDVWDAAAAEFDRIRPHVGTFAASDVIVSKDHYRVQVRDEETWIDLDPAPAALPKTEGVPVGDDELRRQRRDVSFKLVLTRKTGEKSEDVTILAVGFDAAAIAWRPIDLVMVPEKGQLPDEAKLRAMNGKQRIEALGKAKVFRAGLIVDGERHGARPFDLDGRTYDVDQAGGVGVLDEEGAKRLGERLDLGKKKETPALEKIVLEIAVREPSGTRTHRRELYRSGGTALTFGRWSFLVDTGPLPAGERSRKELAGLVANAAAIRSILEGKTADAHVNQHAEVPTLLLRFSDLRRRILLRLLEKRTAFRESLEIFALSRQLHRDGEKLSQHQIVDILDNSIGFATADGRRDPEAALRFGIADTVLESLLLVRAYPKGKDLSAWAALVRAREAGGKLEDKKLDDGRRAVTWSGAAAWWSIDPATGSCVGRVSSGRGQGGIEYAWRQASEVCQFSSLASLWGESDGPGAGMAGDLDRFCGIIGGTWPRDVFQQMLRDALSRLWENAVERLSEMLNEG